MQEYTKHMDIIWQHFSKRTLLLIFVLLCVTGGLLYLAVREEKPAAVPTPTPTPKISYAFSTLSFVPQTATTTSSRQTVAIHIDSNKNQVSGVQVNLAYDPTILGNVTVKLGDYFPNPNVLLNTVDATNGRITLVMAIEPTAQQASGSGTIATLSYTLLPTTQKSTTISFLPKTTVTEEGQLDTVLKSTQNLTIQIPHPVQTKTPLASPSAK